MSVSTPVEASGTRGVALVSGTTRGSPVSRSNTMVDRFEHSVHNHAYRSRVEPSKEGKPSSTKTRPSRRLVNIAEQLESAHFATTTYLKVFCTGRSGVKVQTYRLARGSMLVIELRASVAAKRQNRSDPNHRASLAGERFTPKATSRVTSGSCGTGWSGRLLWLRRTTRSAQWRRGRRNLRGGP